MKKNVPVALATRYPSQTPARLGVVATLIGATLAVSTASAAGTVRNWDGGGTGGGGTSWTSGTGVNWNPDGVPVSGDILTLDNRTVSIPTSMTISAAVGATSITFADGFNSANTTVIGSGSGSAQTLTLDAGTLATGWSLTNNATSGYVTFQPVIGTATGALGITLNGNGTASVAGGGSLVLGTQVIEKTNTPSGITKVDAGTLTLTGANGYSGGTTVNAGTLLVNNPVSGTNSGTGTGAVTVNNSGTLLGGTGYLAGATTINAGATLSPGGTGGTGGNIVGKLTAGGGLTVNGAYQVNLTGTGTPVAGTSYDQTSVVGALTLGTASSLKVIAAMNTGLAVGQVFYIALNDNNLLGTGLFDAVNGTFSQGNIVTDNLGDTYTISYTARGDGSSALLPGNDISLTVASIVPVPEPATAAVGVLVLGALGWTQRRRLLRRRGGLVVVVPAA